MKLTYQITFMLSSWKIEVNHPLNIDKNAEVVLGTVVLPLLIYERQIFNKIKVL